MSQVKASEFIIPEHPTPYQLEQMLAVCSNQIAKIADKLTGYRADMTTKDTAYKRAVARSMIIGRANGVPASIVKSMVEADETVSASKDALDAAEAMFIFAKGEFDGWESHFVALRKMAEIRKTEMRSV